jgi:hypothetical protein
MWKAITRKITIRQQGVLVHSEAFHLPVFSPSVRVTEFGSGWDVIAPWPADSLFNRTGSSFRGVSRFVPS